ncbi:MAG: ParB/RepB/Spo0J family partition protein [Bacteroidaceae bacterium]|nr:ParB/RepB/Spo0J family partition protein [Bacteroidaceae bacterium]
MAVKKKYGTLGRGLDSLISTEDVRPELSSTINEIEISLIDANPNQPRREFDSDALQELAESIAEIGIIQPITLRQMETGRYQIIAGERRWRASQLAHLSTIPAYIRTADDENVMEMALIENIQRQDLNSVEIALAYQHLIDQYGLTQEKLSERVGKKRATVANFLRLLKLPAPVQVALQNHEIDTGHARALLELADPKQQVKFFNVIKEKGYSVRMVEQLIKEYNEREANEGNFAEGKSKSAASKISEEYETIRKNLAELLGTKVKISCTQKGNGKITLEYADDAELKRIIAMISH